MECCLFGHHHFWFGNLWRSSSLASVFFSQLLIVCSPHNGCTEWIYLKRIISSHTSTPNQHVSTSLRLKTQVLTIVYKAQQDLTPLTCVSSSFCSLSLPYSAPATLVTFLYLKHTRQIHASGRLYLPVPSSVWNTISQYLHGLYLCLIQNFIQMLSSLLLLLFFIKWKFAYFLCISWSSRLLDILTPHNLLFFFLVPQPEIESGPWQYNCQVLTTGPPGNSPMLFFSSETFPNHLFKIAETFHPKFYPSIFSIALGIIYFILYLLFFFFLSFAFRLSVVWGLWLICIFFNSVCLGSAIGHST